MKKIIIWGAIGVAAAILIYMIWKSQNQDTPPAVNTNPDTGGSGGNPATPTGYATGLTLGFSPPALDYNKVLRIGVRGREVLVLQRLLNAYTVGANLGPRISEDSNFGQQTLGRLQNILNLPILTQITLADARSRGWSSLINIANSQP